MSLRKTFRHYRRYLALASLGIILVLTPLALYIARTPKEAQARWWNDGWLYRKLVTVSYTGSENLTEYQVLIDGLDTAAMVTGSKLQSDCDDLRFTNTTGAVLPYFIVGATCNTTDTEIFVKVDRITTGDITVYMYYGNPLASAGQNEEATFSYKEEKTVAYLLGDQDTGNDWSGAMNVLSLYNGNSISHNSTTVNLNFFQGSSSFTANDYEPVSAKGLFSITDADQSEIPTPVSWAGTEFTGVTTSISQDDTFYIISPWAETDISLYVNGSSQGSCGVSLPYTISAGGSVQVGCDLTNSANYRITTTDNVPILILYANERSANSDRFPRPLYPAQDSAGQPIYGYDSAGDITNNGTSTNYSYIMDSAATATTGTISADSILTLTVGSGGRFAYTSGPIKIISTTSGGTVSGMQNGDGDGTDATTWVGRREFGTILGMYATTEYIAPVSDQATTCVTYNDDGTTKDTQTLTSTNGEVYGLSSNAFGTSGSVAYEPNQWYMKCDKPVYAWWQNSGDAEKHTVTWPMMRQFTYPTPTTSISGSEELTPYPISFWKFNEGADNTCTGGTNDACDSAAGKNDGTNTATRLTSTSCITGGCLSFDGTDDVVTVPNDSDIDFDLGINDGFSVSFWVKAQSDGENSTGEIIEKGSHFYCRTDTEGGSFVDLECSINLATTDPTVNITDGLTIGTWHHVEATYGDDGDDDLLVYIDGLLRGTGAGEGAPAGTDTSSILIGGDSSNNFHGYIDEVKIFGYERTAEEVKTDYIEGASGAGSNIAAGINTTPMPTPIVHWRFNEMSGTTANNQTSTTSSTGTLANIASPATATSGWTIAGKQGQAIIFDGSNDVVTIATANDADVDFATTETFSGSAWVYVTSMPTSTASDKDLIMGKWDDNSNQATYRLYVENDDTDSTGNIEVQIYDESASQAITATGTTDSIALNTWYHVAFTFNGGTAGAAGDLKLYVNGLYSAQNAQNTSFLGLEDKASDFTVGDYDTNDATAGNTAFAGRIDEVKIYTSTLTADQIKADMNVGSSLNLGTNTNERLVVDPSPTPVDYASTLVGYWPLDENTGTTTTYDKSGGGRNGTLTSITEAAWVPGKLGSALELDGSADYADIGTGPTSIKTVTFWVYPSTTTEYFINLTSTTDYIYANAGTVTAQGLATPTIYVNGITTTTIAANTWSHVAVVTDTAENASNFDIGRTTNSNYLQGVIDDVKLFSSALTQAQVAYEYNRGLPVAWYRLNECQGTTANDASGNGLTGTISIGGTGTYTTPGTCTSGTAAHAWYAGATGKLNSALGFDDTNDYITVSDNNKLDLTSGVSISAWVKPAANEADNVIVSKGTSYELGLTSNGSVYFYNGTSTVDDSSAKATSGAWHHVVMTNNDTTTTYYVDGVSTGTDALGIGADNATSLYIGYDGTNYFDGLIDDVRIFNYVLSPSQVKSVMTGGVVRFE